MNPRLMWPRRRVVLMFALACAALVVLLIVRSGTTAPTREAAETITAIEMQEHIGFLARDGLRGRDTPSPELDTVAEYLVRAFRSLGLEPGAGNGEFVQRYRFPTVELDRERTRLELSHDGGAMVLEYGRDFVAFPGVGEAERAQIIFVDQRVASAAPSGSFDGLAVLALYDDPPIGALREAADTSGAEAAIVVLGQSADATRLYHLARITSRPRRVIGGVRSPPIFLIRRDAVREPLCAARSGLDGCLPEAPAVVPGLEIAVARAPVRVTDNADPAPNVVAVLPGSDPELRDTYVVVSAHMDHLGIGDADASDDSIYNGADDNASGMAALLEVAEAFADLPTAPARSIVFLAVSGTEKELLGSQWFIDHPTIPLDRVVANLNVDMIGRNASDGVFAIGRELSSLGPLVEEVARRHPELNLSVSEDAPIEDLSSEDSRLFFWSDQLSFALQEIPALLISAGTHEGYHQPSDEVDAIDADKAARIARLIFHTTHAVASADESPGWTEQGLALIRRSAR